ncbi:MAG: protoheme IX farnesyltransferase, partial [Candidatus Puniceispirillaceae bacterium]
PYALSMASLFYLAVAAVMGAIFVWLSFSLYKKPSDKAAWKLFKFSIFYLFILFAALIADRLMATLLFGAGSFIG